MSRFASLIVGMLGLFACSDSTGRLTLSTSPDKIDDQGQWSELTLEAMDSDGTPGSGFIALSASAGSFMDSTKVRLDGNGNVEAFFSCNGRIDPRCAGAVLLEATWERPSGNVVARRLITVQVADAGQDEHDAGAIDAGFEDGGVSDGGFDAGFEDGGSADGGFDAGPCPPVPCELTLGVCAGKIHACIDGGLEPVCSNATYGAEYEALETSCDGVDNDCDGVVDVSRPVELGAERSSFGSTWKIGSEYVLASGVGDKIVLDYYSSHLAPTRTLQLPAHDGYSRGSRFGVRLAEVGSNQVVGWTQYVSDGGPNVGVLARIDLDGGSSFPPLTDGGSAGYRVVELGAGWSRLNVLAAANDGSCLLVGWPDQCSGALLRGMTLTPNGEVIVGPRELATHPFGAGGQCYNSYYTSISATPVGAAEFALFGNREIHWYDCSLNESRPTESAPWGDPLRTVALSNPDGGYPEGFAVAYTEPPDQLFLYLARFFPGESPEITLVTGYGSIGVTWPVDVFEGTKGPFAAWGNIPYFSPPYWGRNALAGRSLTEQRDLHPSGEDTIPLGFSGPIDGTYAFFADTYDGGTEFGRYGQLFCEP